MGGRKKKYLMQKQNDDRVRIILQKWKR